jgi:N-glycosylase/DNA lyase
VRADNQLVTIDNIRLAHHARRGEIRARLAQFRDIWKTGSNERLWEELAYCIFTAGASARMGLRSIEAVGSMLGQGTSEEMTIALTGVHRYPRARPGYVVTTREYLHEDCGMRLRDRLEGFSSPIERRDWLACEPRIKGLRYKESSHFLRNIGLSGYAILDKHVLKSLSELGVIENPTPPSTRTRYLETEQRMKEFACDLHIDFDELDLVLWSMKTGEILK